jgi:putative Holliday junction resolvase
MRTLGIDYGTVRIGLALSDSLGMIAQPFCVVKAKSLKEAVSEIGIKCGENGVERIVLGLPRHMNGDESESSKSARKLGDALKAELGLPVFYCDERLSTCAAEKAMLEADVSREKRKEKIDAVAASIILQNYLDMNP